MPSVLKHRSKEDIAAILVSRPDVLEYVPDDEIPAAAEAMGFPPMEVAKARTLLQHEIMRRRNQG